MIKIFTFIFSLLISSSIFSQGTGVLSGTVKDLKTGDALPGVNVILKELITEQQLILMVSLESLIFLRVITMLIYL